jgi:hypothetical protein
MEEVAVGVLPEQVTGVQVGDGRAELSGVLRVGLLAFLVRPIVGAIFCVASWNEQKSSSSGTSYRSARMRKVLSVCGMVDSPTAKRGCTPESTSITFAPLRARMAPRMEPAIPEPRTITSYAPSRACMDFPLWSMWCSFTVRARSSPTCRAAAGS